MVRRYTMHAIDTLPQLAPSDLEVTIRVVDRGTREKYFDTDSGVVSQRIDSLVRKDGEFERVLRTHVGNDESTLAHTLATHVGDRSPLFRLLSPTEADGVLAHLATSLESALRV